MEYRQDLIDYRRNKAKETLQDAKILFDAKRTHSTVNRIYYALFYEVTSLLLTKNLSSSKHSGVLSLFNEHFIKIKKVDVELGRFYSTMFEFRQKSDYGDFMEFEEKKIKEWLEKAEKFIQKIEKLIDI
ncbi:MAG: HEPN domain-containing protein, partial [Cyanobacteria bacterium]|nr:HEPN domain-containing protein [Cyanobacteriota bacterium]